MKRSSIVILLLVLFFVVGSYAQDRATTTVPEIVICASVANKQPVGIDSVFSADVKQLTCYTKIVSELDESEVSHVWFYQDKQMAKVDLKVKGKSYHTWSRKTMMPQWKGDWRVEVQDAGGKVLGQTSFKIQ
jgi:hypothetical protein